MEGSDDDCKEECAENPETKKLNPIVVLEDRRGRHKKQWTTIMEGSDDDCKEECAENTETKKLNPIVVLEDRRGRRKKQGVVDGNKKPKRNIMRRKVKRVNPDHQIFIIHYGGPRLLANEIKNLHPDIVSVNALRQKGKFIVTFPNEMKRNKAFEDLRKTEIEGKLKLSKCSADYKLPFVSGRPDNFDNLKRKRKRFIF